MLEEWVRVWGGRCRAAGVPRATSQGASGHMTHNPKPNRIQTAPAVTVPHYGAHPPRTFPPPPGAQVGGYHSDEASSMDRLTP